MDDKLNPDKYMTPLRTNANLKAGDILCFKNGELNFEIDQVIEILKEGRFTLRVLRIEPEQDFERYNVGPGYEFSYDIKDISQCFVRTIDTAKVWREALK